MFCAECGDGSGYYEITFKDHIGGTTTQTTRCITCVYRQGRKREQMWAIIPYLYKKHSIPLPPVNGLRSTYMLFDDYTKQRGIEVEIILRKDKTLLEVIEDFFREEYEHVNG